MPRFVILRHDDPRGLHWDFMLEVGPTLRTWALARAPQSGTVVEARPLFEHRRAYLDYEGPLSGNRGTVTRYDQGTYRSEREAADSWMVVLEGAKLSGRATLTRSTSGEERWEFAAE